MTCHHTHGDSRIHLISFHLQWSHPHIPHLESRLYWRKHSKWTLTFTTSSQCNKRVVHLQSWGQRRRVKKETNSRNIIHSNAVPLALPSTYSKLDKAFSWLRPVWCWRYNFYCRLIGDNIPYLMEKCSENVLVNFVVLFMQKKSFRNFYEHIQQ